MDFVTQTKLIKRLDKLITRCASGSPDELCVKLGISRRTLFRLISFLRSEGIPIDYSKVRKTYFYYNTGELIVLGWMPEVNLKKVKTSKNGQAVHTDL
jgi:biotin operon repressor